MGASRFEYRFRFVLHLVIFAIGAWAPWLYWGNVFGLSNHSLWLVIASWMTRTGHMDFGAATMSVLVVVLLLTALAAWFRVWGSAYVGTGIVHSHDMHGDAMLADGPYRHTRNPLYLGTLLHALGIAILMSPSGAIFTVGLVWAFQIRLALAEEPFLLKQFGATYAEYAKHVPRFLPTLSPQVPAAGAKPHWIQAVFGELYFVAAFLVLAVLGWNFNARPLQQGLLISLGAWLVARAFLPQAKSAPTAPASA